MRQIDLSADQLIDALLALAASESVCVLDSCGVGHLGSHLLIAGVRPVATIETSSDDPEKTLDEFGELLSRPGLATIFTLSYEFGAKLQRTPWLPGPEPDVFAASFDCLVVHDYSSGATYLTGRADRFDEVERLILASPKQTRHHTRAERGIARSNFTRDGYISAVERVKQNIRCGQTYQTNLTQQISVELGKGRTAENIFADLRKTHPAPFGAFIRRRGSTVVSASPERFFKVAGSKITASPIKGTRPRGRTASEDDRLRAELLSSKKDIAENTMIVDLTRNDLGRICEYGSVSVGRLCELEEHPTLFHLVSTVSGKLTGKCSYADIVRALYPCGSITGAPKLSTMNIISGLEQTPRGLSMGSIGVNIAVGFDGLEPAFEMNVAIRTMAVADGRAVFSVGGGIVIDSHPSGEYDESLLKAKALLSAARADLNPGN